MPVDGLNAVHSAIHELDVAVAINAMLGHPHMPHEVANSQWEKDAEVGFFSQTTTSKRAN